MATWRNLSRPVSCALWESMQRICDDLHDKDRGAGDRLGVPVESVPGKDKVTGGWIARAVTVPGQTTNGPSDSFRRGIVGASPKLDAALAKENDASPHTPRSPCWRRGVSSP